MILYQGKISAIVLLFGLNVLRFNLVFIELHRIINCRHTLVHI